MPEMMQDRKIYSLLQVGKSIQRTISDRYGSAFWVKAEMNKLNRYSHSGHCYPELLEKVDGKVVANMKSILWKGDYEKINQNFLKTLSEPLKDGIKILFLARVTYDANHGMALQILDIDPSFTLGDLEKEKKESVERLQSENIFHLNKSTRLSLLPQRIAIISVETSKGYADFLKVLNENAWHYKFFHLLFPSLLQGENAVPGIISQLTRIKKVQQHFDVVAIIRGGGGDVGLSCYNNYQLAKAIATFPLPVITGIGHATNETVSEMVSFQNAITPTKIAEFLIQRFHNFSVPVKKAQELIADRALRIIAEEKHRTQSEARLFRSVTEAIIAKNRSLIETARQSIGQKSLFLLQQKNSELLLSQLQLNKNTDNMLRTHRQIHQDHASRLPLVTLQTLTTEKVQIETLERTLSLLDPVNILKRGYSITYHNGMALKDSQSLSDGDQIQTRLFNGVINSTVTKQNHE